MPSYDYLCQACNHKFEEFQKYSDAELTKCPKCKKKKLQRLFGNGIVVIRGSTHPSMGGYEVPMDSPEQKLQERLSDIL